MTNSINLRVNDDLKQAIDKAAEQNGLPVASYVKHVLTKELRTQGFLGDTPSKRSAKN